MKELKRLSLKEEVDREARQIEKEVRDRDDLDDIKVSEDMETSLFNKIQDYEYDRRTKIVRRKKKKVYVIAAVAAVFVLVFGSVMTSVGSKSYWKVLWDRIAGEEKLSYIDVDNMDSQETEDLDEVQIYKEITKELGISTVRLGYLPRKTILEEYELDKEQARAILLYRNKEQIIRYMMYMNDADSSLGQIETDAFLDEYRLEAENDVIIKIKHYRVSGKKQDRYIAEFEYMDAQYQIMGTMEKSEFEKIIKNLIFL